ncbi:hypothetical protein JCM30760_26830 [Thiomicrorhabdus hydrogeniphila]
MAKKFSLKSLKPREDKESKTTKGLQSNIDAELFINGAETETQKDVVENSLNQILDIPLEQIEPNHFNARIFYSEEKIKSRALSLTKEGQLVPAIVVMDGNKYKLIDGHYRYKAAILSNILTLRCEVLHGGMSGFDYFKASYAANEERDVQSVLDDAVAWKRMVETEGLSFTELCDITNRSKGEVSKVIRIGSIPFEYLAALSEKLTPIKTHAGYALAQIFDKLGSGDEFHSIIKKVVENDLSKQDVEKIKTDILNKNEKPVARPKKLPKHQFTDHNGKVKGSLDYSGKKINMKFEAPSAEAAEEIAKAIATILEDAHE